jgi:hypothetical protein
MKQLYKNIFEKMTPSKRDKDIDVVMKQSQQAIDIAKANLRSYLTVEEYEF